MSNGHADPAFHREQLSALVDGELPAGAAVAAACAAWKDDADLRAAWHRYQLIGDVLRSEDLASEPARDAAFMQALRRRLAADPVVLAPAPPQQPPRSVRDTPRTGRRSSWAMPAAVAAGFVAVAGVLLVTRAPPPPAAADRTIAAAPRSSPTVTGRPLLAGTASASDQTAVPIVGLDPLTPRGGAFVTSNRIVLRDPQLDRYLAAHRQFAGSTALGMPSGLLRNASAEVPGR